MAGPRLPWAEVDGGVRDAVHLALGSPIVEAVNQWGGFSPGTGARCRLADGRRCFVKASSLHLNEQSVTLYRQEADRHRQLPEAVGAARLWHVHDDGRWIVLVFDEIDGVMPTQPWRDDELSRVFRELDRIGAIEVPHLAPWTDVMGAEFEGWMSFGEDLPDDPWIDRHRDRLLAAEAHLATAMTGTALVHNDVRDDNVLLGADGRTTLVDWTGACAGRPRFDALCMLPSIEVRGGPPPDVVCDRHGLLEGLDDDFVDAVVAGLAGLFAYRGSLPDPPNLPTVRQFQRDQAAVTVAWLARRWA
jgi:hypothetical protein